MANDRNKTKETAAAADQSANKEELEDRRAADHSSPELDAELYTAIHDRVSLSRQLAKQAIQKIQKLEGNETEEALASICKAVDETILPAMTETIDTLSAFFDNAAFKDSMDSMQRIISLSDEIKERIEKLKRLKPYIEAELKKPEYQGKGITVDNIFSEESIDLYRKNKNKSSSDKLKSEIIKAALVAMNADAEEERPIKKNGVKLDLQAFGNALQKIDYINSANLKLSTDKFQNIFFSLCAPQSKGCLNGQRQFIPVRYERSGAEKEITLYYDYAFNNELISQHGLSKEFDGRAYFVAAIVDNLLDEGNTDVSITKIWHELGHKGSPSKEALEELHNILLLGMSTIVTADVTEIKKAWDISSNELKDELLSPVIPIQIVNEKFIANGQISNALIHITGHSPFYIIGNSIKHFSTWDKDVLRLYNGRRTKRYYNVMQFLMTQIAYMRNAKSQRSDKILYETLYTRNDDKSTRDKQLTRDMMYKLFDEVFIPTGYIVGYKEVTTGTPGVKLNFKKNKANNRQVSKKKVIKEKSQ